jgi:hypothetical protein
VSPQLHSPTVLAFLPVPDDRDPALTLPALCSSQRLPNRIEPRGVDHSKKTVRRAGNSVFDNSAAGSEEARVEASALRVADLSREYHSATRETELCMSYEMLHDWNEKFLPDC